VSSNDIGETMTALNQLLEAQQLVALEPAEATDQNAFAVTTDFRRTEPARDPQRPR
jgi:hypothetical protein